MLLRLTKRCLPCAAILVATLVFAQSAAAHSTLIATEPARDRVVEEPPEEVVLRFDEAVETALGSVAVYDGEGNRVDSERVTRPDPRSVRVDIDSDLERGTYTVAWRVISADSDPINGAWVFHVQERGPQPAGVAAQVLDDTPFTVSVFYLGGRFVDFSLLLLCVGGALALVLALPRASETVRRRLFGLLAAFAAALTVVALVGLGLQAAAAGGGNLTDGFTSDAITSVADTRFGHFSLARAGLAATLCLLALEARRSAAERAPAAAVVAVLVATGLVFTPGLSGHASVSGPVSTAADAAHVSAAAVWTGGLAFVVIALVMTRGERWRLAASSVPRFSTMAVVSVAVLLIAGAINGYLQVRAWRGLWETEYGVLLLVKIGLVLPLLALGAYNNRYAVPRLREQIASMVERRRFLRLAGVELVIMLVVVGVTAGLVNAPPARTEIEMHDESAMELMLGPMRATLEVMPGAVGRNEIHVEFSKGRPDELRVSATLEARKIGPLRYRARRGMEPGAYVVKGANLAPSGEWELRIDARRGEFDLYSEKVQMMIEKEF